MFKALELIPKSKNMDSIAISGIYYEMGFVKVIDKFAEVKSQSQKPQWDYLLPRGPICKYFSPLSKHTSMYLKILKFYCFTFINFFTSTIIYAFLFWT